MIVRTTNQQHFVEFYSIRSVRNDASVDYYMRSLFYRLYARSCFTYRQSFYCTVQSDVERHRQIIAIEQTVSSHRGALDIKVIHADQHVTVLAEHHLT